MIRPFRGDGAGFCQHVGTDIIHEVEAFRQGDEHDRRDGFAVVIMHAQQHLEAVQALVAKAHDGLEIQSEVAGTIARRLAQQTFHVGERVVVPVHLRIVDMHGIAAGLARGLAHEGGLTGELGAVGGLFGIEGNAHGDGAGQ